MSRAGSKPKTTLTGQELEIMKVIWKLGTPTVRQVYENLLERRKVAYTTVMTMMNILEQKGYLKKRQGDRAFVYTPSRPEKQVIRAMVREFVDRVFNGAAEPLNSSTAFLTAPRSRCCCTWWRMTSSPRKSSMRSGRAFGHELPSVR